MPAVTLKLLPTEPVWPDLDLSKVVHLGEGAPPIEIAVLDKGMTSGRPSVALKIELPDGTVVVAETSALLFCTAGRAITAKYPGLFD